MPKSYKIRNPKQQFHDNMNPDRMNSLKTVLQFLNDTLDPEIQQNIESCHRRSLNWERVDRLPLIITF